MGVRIELKRPRSPLDYLLLIPVFVIGAILMVVGLVLGFFLFLSMPIIVWWKQRQLRREGPEGPNAPNAPNGPKVIDAEFTVRKDE